MAAIRLARKSDAQDLAALAEQTFRDTFAEMNTADDMALHCRTSYGENIQLAEIENLNLATLVCEDHGELIAYAQLSWGKGPGCVRGSSPGEVKRLYVRKDWHGKGIAQQLMAACLAEMEKRNSDVVWLGVWERNPRAISFYKKCGFVEVGEQIFPLGTDPQRDIVMMRATAKHRV